MVREVFLVGVGMGGPGSLTIEAREAIDRSGLLIGASRMIAPYEHAGCRTLARYRAEDIVKELHEAGEDVASVLFSGDVGFYSAAAALVEKLSTESGMHVRAIPGIPSVAYFCAKLLVPWQDVPLVSAHGRDCNPVAVIREHGKAFFLTGGKTKAQDICAALVRAGLGALEAHVGERLSYPDEVLTHGTAADLATRVFCDLAVLYVQVAEMTKKGQSPVVQQAPRLLIASPASGAGKTTFTSGLLRALANRGLRVQACKCGPDYLDPLYHAQATGRPSRNLDLFFMDASQVRNLVAEGAKDSDVTVLEGAMGYYDGIATGDEASAWDVARTTETPAVLVVDGRGRALSVAAEVAGFVRFRHPSQVAGVVFNRVSPTFYPRLKELVERECGIPVFGYLPAMEDCHLESRHLGLVAAGEVVGLQETLERLALAVERYVDVDGLLSLAATAPSIAQEESFLPQRVEGSPAIAVARDEAFCFYYDDTLRLLENLGAHVVEFSPLADEGLPDGVCGLYLGGGYPELHARELAENTPMTAAIREAVESGMPTIAECGGFLYLHERLEDDEGSLWPMADVIPGTARRGEGLRRFGYIEMTARCGNVLTDAGDTLRAHEFHYWESGNAGTCFHAQKPCSSRAWECAHATTSLYAGFPHLCLHAQPEIAARFVRACAAYGASDKAAEDAMPEGGES